MRADGERQRNMKKTQLVGFSLSSPYVRDARSQEPKKMKIIVAFLNFANVPINDSRCV